MLRISADLTYLDSQFERDVVIDIDETTGLIEHVARGSTEHTGVQKLAGRALLPGFCNVHSHAFQRLIRGRTQWRPATAPPADFWSWREAMYGALLPLAPEDVHAVSRFCFVEMLKAGYTSVGEFHYLQNDPDGKPYDDALELHNAVLAAAKETGIRIVLINTAYAMGGVNQPLRPPQRRFNTPKLDEFLATCDQLKTRVANEERATMAVAPHSIRAVPREWIKPIHDWAARANVAMHMHVSEQIAEVEACEQAFGKRPVEVLYDAGVLDDRFTAIHATHVSMHEIALLARARATVCACPSTERDLGDGFLQAASLHAASAHVAIGTDSQTIIDPFEELRLIEYHERLRRNERVVLSRIADERAAVAPTLLRYGTSEGARALRVNAGAIATGKQADLVAIDLSDIKIAGWTVDNLDALLTLSASASLVTDVWVAGRAVVENAQHAAGHESTAAFLAVAAR